jgi:hypothetical protein
VPFLAVFAAWGMTRILNTDTRIGTRIHVWKAVVALVLIALLVLNWGLELQRDASTLAAMFGPGGNMIGAGY